MTRVVLRGGRVFDGTGADPAPADAAIDGGRTVGLVVIGGDPYDFVDLRDRVEHVWEAGTRVD